MPHATPQVLEGVLHVQVGCYMYMVLHFRDGTGRFVSQTGGVTGRVVTWGSIKPHITAPSMPPSLVVPLILPIRGGVTPTCKGCYVNGVLHACGVTGR